MDLHTTNTKLSPTQVITVYNDHHQNRYYLEHRNVKNVNGRLTLMAASPMEEDVFRNIAAAFITNQEATLKFNGLIPGHILYGFNDLGRTAIIWYRPAQKRILNLSVGAVKKTITSPLPIPATLYIIKDDSLYIFALMDDSRPSMETKLYRAPFFNIYGDGKVCLGTARLGNRTESFEGEADRYERGFYLAEQNHINGEACRTPIGRLWPKLEKSTAPFPSKEELKQHGTYRTLGDVIQNLITKK